MANTLMKLLVELGVDSAGLDAGLDKAEKTVKSGVGKTFAGLATLGAGVAAGIGVAAAAAGVALAATIKPASDLGEAMNAVKVVFGENADEILKFGENSAMAVGLSGREFNQLSAEMGAMLGNVGVAEDELGGKTIELVSRAADMASIFNTDVGQAFNAMQSAIKGEFNPLEQFGVKMNAAMIEAKALSMGLVGTTQDLTKIESATIAFEKASKKSIDVSKKFGLESLEARDAVNKEVKAYDALQAALAGKTDEITDSMKAEAALALMMEQTSSVAGDFQNTAGGWANSQRQMAAMAEDLKAKVGTGLLPAMEAFAATVKEIAASPEFQAFLDGIIAGVAKLGQWLAESIPVAIENFSKFTNWLKENQGVVVAILAILGVALIAFGVSAAIAAVTAIAPLLPIIAVIAAIGAAVYLLYEAWTNNWGGIQEKTAAVIQALVDFWTNTLVPAFQSGVAFFQEVFAVIAAVWQALVPVFTYVWNIIMVIWGAFQAAFRGDWETFGGLLRLAWDAIWAGIITILETSWEAIKGIVANLVESVISFFRDTDWGEVGMNIIQGIANGITAGVSWIVNAARSAAEAAVSAAKGFLGINSPSALFMDIGNNLMKGFAIGIDQAAGLPELAVATATSGMAAPSGREDIASALAAMPRGGIDEDRLGRSIVTHLLRGMAQQ